MGWLQWAIADRGDGYDIGSRESAREREDQARGEWQGAGSREQGVHGGWMGPGEASPSGVTRQRVVSLSQLPFDWG
jgi:hypothetical protein